MANDAPRILIVEAPYYPDIAKSLADGAIAHLREKGYTYNKISVAGALEIPAAIRMAIRAMDEGTMDLNYVGFIALGCVIRGETGHYDQVAGESIRALMDLSTQHGVPIGNGILTVENMDQAKARAGGAKCDKGRDAAEACLGLLAIQDGFGL